MQYGVAAWQAAAAIEQLRSSEFARSNPSRVLELKFLKGSDLSYLGPNAGYDSVSAGTPMAASTCPATRALSSCKRAEISTLRAGRGEQFGRA
jgi:hypothetical protein